MTHHHSASIPHILTKRSVIHAGTRSSSVPNNRPGLWLQPGGQRVDRSPRTSHYAFSSPQRRRMLRAAPCTPLGVTSTATIMSSATPNVPISCTELISSPSAHIDAQAPQWCPTTGTVAHTRWPLRRAERMTPTHYAASSPPSFIVIVLPCAHTPGQRRAMALPAQRLFAENAAPLSLALFSIVDLRICFARAPMLSSHSSLCLCLDACDFMPDTSVCMTRAQPGSSPRKAKGVCVCACIFVC